MRVASPDRGRRFGEQAGAGDFPLWFEAGEKLNGTIASGLTLFWMQMILMNWVEVRRWMDMKNPGSVNQVRPTHTLPALPRSGPFSPHRCSTNVVPCALTHTFSFGVAVEEALACLGFA